MTELVPPIMFSSGRERLSDMSRLIKIKSRSLEFDKERLAKMRRATWISIEVLTFCLRHFKYIFSAFNIREMYILIYF